jgi:hypothetical protein
MLVSAIEKLRRKRSLLNARLRELLADSEEEALHAAKVVNNIARPYLKNCNKTQQTALVVNAKEMADALQTAANLPLITVVDLVTAISDIKFIAHQADQLILSRSEEKAFKKAQGTATGMRKLLEKQLKFVLYSTIPVYHLAATGALALQFEHTIIAINGTLDTFRHLLSHGWSEEPTNKIPPPELISIEIQ